MHSDTQNLEVQTSEPVVLLRDLFTQKHLLAIGASQPLATRINRDLRWYLSQRRILPDDKFKGLTFEHGTVEEFVARVEENQGCIYIYNVGEKKKKLINSLLVAHGYPPVFTAF